MMGQQGVPHHSLPSITYVEVTMEKHQALKEYKELISKAKNRLPEDLEYSESHHIRPRSMGGRPKHTVYLTIPEHVKAHELLMYATFGTEHHVKMVQAYFGMCNMNYFTDKVDPEALEFARKKLSEGMTGEKNPAKQPAVRKKMSKALKGEKNPMYNKKHSAETRAKMAEAQKGEKGNMWGKKRSAETRAKISATLKGQIPCNKGKKRSAETRARISATLKGRIPWNKGLRYSLKKKQEK